MLIQTITLSERKFKIKFYKIEKKRSGRDDLVERLKIFDNLSVEKLKV